MATAEIFLDLEQLQKEIISINDRKLREIDKAMQSSCNAVASLTVNGWAGDAKDVFMDNFTQHKNDMRCFYEYVKEFNKQLKAIHNDGKKLASQGDRMAGKL